RNRDLPHRLSRKRRHCDTVVRNRHTPVSRQISVGQRKRSRWARSSYCVLDTTRRAALCSCVRSRRLCGTGLWTLSSTLGPQRIVCRQVVHLSKQRLQILRMLLWSSFLH